MTTAYKYRRWVALNSAKQGQRGVAMVIVLCAFALILALGTGALVAANASYATTINSVSQQQAYLTAYSFCETLRTELENNDSAICAKLKAIPDGGQTDMTGATTDMGSATGITERSGNRLSVTVDGEYNGMHSKMQMQLILQNGKWVFNTYLPVA
ncbi:MAG: hypothetical protein RR232_06385 [Clostridia bacterium]